MRIKDLFKRKPTNDYVEDKSMFTKEKVIESFPEAYGYTKEYISKFVDDTISAANHKDAEEIIFGAVLYTNPLIDYSDKSWYELTKQEQQARTDYSNWRSEKFYQWAHEVSDKCWPLYNTNKIRSKDEALDIIADFLG